MSSRNIFTVVGIALTGLLAIIVEAQTLPQTQPVPIQPNEIRKTRPKFYKQVSDFTLLELECPGPLDVYSGITGKPTATGVKFESLQFVDGSAVYRFVDPAGETCSSPVDKIAAIHVLHPDVAKK